MFAIKAGAHWCGAHEGGNTTTFLKRLYLEGSVQYARLLDKRKIKIVKVFKLLVPSLC
jgi:hypothetical protein